MSNIESDSDKLKRLLREIATLMQECNDSTLWHCRTVMSTVYQWLMYEDVNTAAVIDMINTMIRHFDGLRQTYKGEWQADELAVRLVDLANECLEFGITTLGRGDRINDVRNNLAENNQKDK